MASVQIAKPCTTVASRVLSPALIAAALAAWKSEPWCLCAVATLALLAGVGVTARSRIGMSIYMNAALAVALGSHPKSSLPVT